MPTLSTTVRRVLLSTAALLPALPAVCHADAVSYFAAYSGAGNVSVFDPVAGTGGWVGSIDAVPPPVVGDLPSLVPVVLFTIDPLTNLFTGTFEFDTTDLQSSLYGSLSGAADPGFLTVGGQLSIDYAILGGTGAFDSANGFGLAFLNYDPAGGFNNYSETGLFSFAVPEPGSLALAGLGLAVIAVRRRKAAVAG